MRRSGVAILLLCAMLFRFKTVVAQCAREDEFYPTDVSSPAVITLTAGFSSWILNGLVVCAAAPEGDFFSFVWPNNDPKTVLDVQLDYDGESMDANLALVQLTPSIQELATSATGVQARERLMWYPTQGRTYGLSISYAHAVGVPEYNASAIGDYQLRLRTIPNFCDGYDSDELDQFADLRNITRVGIVKGQAWPDLRVCFGNDDDYWGQIDDEDGSTANSTALVEIHFQPHMDPDFDPTLILSTSSNSPLDKSSNSPPSSTEVVMMNYPTGIPDSTILHFSVQPTYGKGNYSISLSSCREDHFSPNHSPSEATSIVAAASPAIFSFNNASMCAGEQPDYFDIDLSAASISGNKNVFIAAYPTFFSSTPYRGTTVIEGAFSSTSLGAADYPAISVGTATANRGYLLIPSTASDAVLRLRVRGVRRHGIPLAFDGYWLVIQPFGTTDVSCIPLGSDVSMTPSQSTGLANSPVISICPQTTQRFVVSLRDSLVATDLDLSFALNDVESEWLGIEARVQVVHPNSGALLVEKVVDTHTLTQLVQVPYAAFQGAASVFVDVTNPIGNRIDVTLSSAERRCASDIFEPNNSPGNARTIVTSPSSASVCIGNDDYFVVFRNTTYNAHIASVHVHGIAIMLDLVDEFDNVIMQGSPSASGVALTVRDLSKTSAAVFARVRTTTRASAPYTIEIFERWRFQDTSANVISVPNGGVPTTGEPTIPTTAAVIVPISTAVIVPTSTAIVPESLLTTTTSVTASGSSRTPASAAALTTSDASGSVVVVIVVVAVLFVVCVIAAIVFLIRKRSVSADDRPPMEMDAVQESGVAFYASTPTSGFASSVATPARQTNYQSAPISAGSSAQEFSNHSVGHYGAMDASSGTIPMSGRSSPWGLPQTNADASGVTKTAKYQRSWEIDYREISVDRQIGQGSFGKVYTGTFRDQEVAVKILATDEGPLPDSALKEFESEAELMSKLRPHQNVLLFLGVCTEPILAIVTEFVKGGSLADVLLDATLQLSAEVRLNIARGIVAGMVHLHRERIIHRDLAARNVLLSADWVAKIADFGLSRVDSGDGVNVTKAAVGPLKWMSPEALANRNYSEKSDVWSLGVTLWELYSREIPYDDLEPQQVAIQVASGQLTPPTLAADRCPPQVMAVIRQCWAFSPEARPDMAGVQSQINAFAGGSSALPLTPYMDTATALASHGSNTILH